MHRHIHIHVHIYYIYSCLHIGLNVGVFAEQMLFMYLAIFTCAPDPNAFSMYCSVHVLLTACVDCVKFELCYRTPELQLQTLARKQELKPQSRMGDP